MHIKEHMVFVYRPGIYELAAGEWDRGVVIEFDRNEGFGFIESSRNQRIFFHVSQIQDKSIRVLDGQKVEFDLNRTAKGLAAINVELIEG